LYLKKNNKNSKKALAFTRAFYYNSQCCDIDSVEA
jgi:hypothetical protein